MRAAILVVGGLVVGLLMGFVVGLAAGGNQTETAQRPPKTVIVEKTVQAPTPTPTPTPTSTATSTATAYAASLPEASATKECSINELCDLTTGEVTITDIQRTDVIETGGTAYAGSFIVVYFDYTYKGNATAETKEAPWSLIDSEGNTYSMNFDATSSYGIEQNAGVAIYEQVQPNVPNRGLIVFEVAPNSQPETLIISDLVNVQGGEIAKVEL